MVFRINKNSPDGFAKISEDFSGMVNPALLQNLSALKITPKSSAVIAVKNVELISPDSNQTDPRNFDTSPAPAITPAPTDVVAKTSKWSQLSPAMKGLTIVAGVAFLYTGVIVVRKIASMPKSAPKIKN